MKKFTSVAVAVACAALVFINLSCVNVSNDASDSTPAGTTGQTPAGAAPGETPPASQNPVSYKVNIATSIEHGSVTASPTSATAGTEITLTATSASGYVWSSYTVTGAGGAAVSVSAQGKFTMPASDVTVSAVFVVGVNANLSNFASTVQALTQDSTIAMTGQLTSGDLAAIKSALQASQYMIKLDLRAVTGLDSLPERAFEFCAKLQEIILPEGVTSIGSYAFGGCEALERVSLPASVASIIWDAFSCGNLLSVNIDQGNAVYSSLDGVLFSKDKKTLIFCPKGKGGAYAIPSGVKVIGKSAFMGCSNLTGIAIPDGVEKIEEDAFSTLGIASLELPDSVTVMEERALLACSSLTSLKLSANLTKISDYALSGIGVESLVIPASVTSIGQYVFNNCSALTSVEFKAPSGWKRTTSSVDWENRTGGESVDEGDLSNPATNATNFKKTTAGGNCWGLFYWYKSTQN